MITRRLALTVLFASVLLYAQTGIGRGIHGIRVPSAHTLEQGIIYVSGSFESVSDGHPLAMDGFVSEATGKKILLDEQTASSGGNLLIGYGLFDFLELDLMLPLYYDGYVSGTKLDGLGMGDLQASAKVSFPLNLPIYLSLQGDIFAPTGSKSLGFRPRHAWFLNKTDGSYAYTAGAVAFAGSAFLTFDFFGILYWNSFASYTTVIDKNSDVLTLGSGFELFPNKMISLITELSGEVRVTNPSRVGHFWNEMVRFTPGLRIHLPHDADILFGADIGINFVRTPKIEDGINVERKNDKDRLNYTIPGAHELGYVLAITKKFNISRKDSDNDGIPDRLDMCPGTYFGAVVNPRGCPVDQDQDGVLNIVDDCPNTPFGIAVDFFGCPLDEDHDSVPDYLDKCQGTPAGMAVDKDGCIRDTDSDGVDDNADLCPNTVPGEKVNATGCPVDEDHDGVPNELDKCPGTLPERSVDNTGCPMDFDKDGVPDDLDKCPNSLPGEIVNSDGCPADQDQDGVSDSKDQCPDTPAGYPVDVSGCPSDHDNDSIPDALDKCPNTAPGAPVDTTGCPIDSDNDGIADYLDKCPETFPDVLVNKDGCPYNGKMDLNKIAQKIHFKGNTEKFMNSSYNTLDDIVELGRRYNFDMEIQCSANGEKAQEISDARANAILEYLVYKGFEAKRLKAQGFGQSLPPLDKRPQTNSATRLIPTNTTK